MKRGWVRLAILTFWMAMTGWLLRYEAFPDIFTNTVDGYRHLFGEGVLAKDAWMKIVFQGSPIGYTHTRLDINDTRPDEYCVVNNRTFLSLKIMGEAQRVSVRAVATLNNTYQLKSFSFSLSSGGYATRVDGTRGQGQTFNVRIDTGGQAQQTQVQIPDDAVLYSPLTEMAMKNLKPGQRMTVKAFDPTTMTVANLVVNALRKEVMDDRGTRKDATVLSLDYRGMEILSWIDADGEILRQETPFGWTLVACAPEDAVSVEKGAGGPADILAAMAVPTQGAITRPRECRKLRLELSGARLEGLALPRARQSVDLTNELSTVITIAAQNPPRPGAVAGKIPAALQPYLASSPFIQSEHPMIVAQAKAIIRDRTNLWDKAVAIHDWVYKSVDKNPAVVLPSALEVLKRRQGDCKEHTYLFVALARAAGLPAKVTVGLVYAHAAFYYHAWPSVYVGEWVEMDPTFGQPTVDAAHVALLEGELQDQLKLMQVIGRLKLRVLAQEY